MPVILAEAPKQNIVGIRPALRPDLRRIMEIERLAFDHRWDYYQFKASLEDIFLVAVDGMSGDLVGYIIACCCLVSRRGLILRVAVHPDYQGRGVATSLMQEAFKALKKKDLTEVELDVDILKAGARRLYEKMGFKVMEVFSPDFEADESFYIMRKKLGP